MGHLSLVSESYPDIINSSSQVLVQQPSVLSESLLVDQHSLPSHTQIVEQQNLETATYVQALNDNTASLSFDTSGSTLIADRDGTYSIATAVNDDISITIEKDSNLETFSFWNFFQNFPKIFLKIIF